MENKESPTTERSSHSSGLDESQQRLESTEVPEARLDKSRGAERDELHQEMVAADAQSEVLKAEIVDELVAITPIARDETWVNLAIASYFQEKGSDLLYQIYRGMDDITQKALKDAIARGDLEKVVTLVEKHDPTISESARRMYSSERGDEEFVRAFDRANWLLVERTATIVKKHSDLARQWRETGVPPVADTAEVKQKLAELPLDMRDFLEKIDPETRRTVINDQILLETSVEDLYSVFPALRRELARAHLREHHPRKKSSKTDSIDAG